MILLDPELEPDSALASAYAKQSAASGLLKNLRIPSKRTLGRYLSDAQSAVGLLGQVTVLLTTDRNDPRFESAVPRQGRGDGRPFLLCHKSAPKPGKIAGDLAISVETARKQAAEQGHALGVELRVLILHGLLHLAGYDHETDAGRMQRRERQLRAKLGLPQGLIERRGQNGRGPSARRRGGASHDSA